MGENVCAHIGELIEDARLEIHGIKGEKIVSTPLSELKEAWQQPLRW
jgi:hypothetical protein